MPNIILKSTACVLVSSGSACLLAKHKCWSVGKIFTFGHQRVIILSVGHPEKLSAINFSHKNFDQQLNSILDSLLCAQFDIILWDNTIIIHINLIWSKLTKTTSNKTYGHRNGTKLRSPQPQVLNLLLHPQIFGLWSNTAKHSGKKELPEFMALRQGKANQIILIPLPGNSII